MKHKIKFSKRYLKENLITKRAKILYIISCIFQIPIIMPNYEIKAQIERAKLEQLYKKMC